MNKNKINDLKLLKSRIGKYKLTILESLELIYRDLNKKFSWQMMSTLSKNELLTLRFRAYEEMGKGGYNKNSGINPKGVSFHG